MREKIVPPLIPTPVARNTTDFVLEQAEKPANPALFAKRDASGTWQDVSAKEFRADVERIAKGLIAEGVGLGDRVGIMARTCYEWTLVDFAIWFAGAVSVPVYETSSPSQIAWNLDNSGAVAAFGENAHHENAIRQAVDSEGLAAMKHVWQMSTAGLDALRAAGASVSDEVLETRRSAATLESVATIIYTSGTMGRPKGCELTHGNFVALSENAAMALGVVVKPKSKTIMFLPLAHVFGRFISVLAVAAGAQVAHTPDVKNLLADLQSFEPTFLLVVPRIFERVYNSALTKAEDSGKGKIFHRAGDIAITWSKAHEDGGKPSLGLRLQHALYDVLVYRKLRAAMGGHVKYAVSGGGPLGERLGHFFHGVGLLVLEGYGLTETTAPLTVGTPSLVKIGTVGPPLPGNGVRIADDGEILAKGVCVMRGYYNLPELQTQAFTDGWFHTGDVGELDADGYLRITGRKKDIIITAGGKNVAPAPLEDEIRADTLVSQVVVVGEKRPFIAALVTLDEEALPGWLERSGLPAGLSVQDATTHPAVLAHVQTVIDHANSSVSRAEAIKSFRIVPTDFTEDSGHLTPSLKVKRDQVMTDFGEYVDEIYSAPKPSVV
ncbi:AMP-dependent synthetase/ligase [Sinomonas notoginsengisoli]|uniref:AMP-dependent synthetase/ligase n=1 Tax=Sinomonas notoginsengisoli TaxID=1457311 RepID=UPI001F188472|nr:AMP-dependent synthetase/ligase [Sinomonas notoginsengisoli]